jgi:sarcosine oxidase subunit delta
MKLMNCPLNGPRNLQEFACGGEVVAEPAPDAAPETWSAYVFLQDNPAGVVREWWCHLPTSYWFIAERDTRTDEILRTYPAAGLFAGEGQ